MCVYCKGASECDHERDACEASRGERCFTCGHGSAAFLSYPPGPRRTMVWVPKANPRKRKPPTGAAQAPRARTNKKAR
jgi:hypothetical protein